MVVRGIVRTPQGNPVAGAHVALVAPWSLRAAGRTRSGADGRYAIEVPAGEYAATATAAAWAAAFQEPSELGPESEEQTLVLGKDGFTLSGRVRDEEDRPIAGAALRLVRISNQEGDVFYTRTDGEGRYAVRLIPAEGYRLRLESDEYLATPQEISGSAEQAAIGEDPPSGPRCW